MRGVPSEAMVMCASTPDKVEILTPPPGCVPGDRVTCEGYPGEGRLERLLGERERERERGGG